MTCCCDSAGRDADYHMSGFFSSEHRHDAFGVLTKVHSKRRLIERVNVAFPLRFSARI